MTNQSTDPFVVIDVRRLTLAPGQMKNTALRQILLKNGAAITPFHKNRMAILYNNYQKIITIVSIK